MKRFAYSTAALLAFGLIALDGVRETRLSAAAADEHDYFDSLTRRADAWKSYSLRTAAQLAHRSQGGYSEGNATDASGVTYSPGSDTDRNRQDAAKVVIPAWMPDTTLTAAVSPSDTVLQLAAAYRPSFPSGRVIRVDREVMTVATWLSDTSISVRRGEYASAAASHGAGAILNRTTNSLRSQVRLPLGTQDGHSYFVTWDAYWTDSYIGAGSFNHKAFQFSSGSQDGDALFLEPDAKYNDNKKSCWNPNLHVASFQVRSYNKEGGLLNWLLSGGDSLGPGHSKEPLGPKTADFCSAPNQWVRFFMNIRQRANDYDYVDMWIADEAQDPVQVLSNVAISVRPSGKSPNSISKFWVEFNSSTDDYLRLDNRDLVAYVRNFVALQDSGDPRGLLVRPVPGAQPVPGPAAPRNVRIIS